MTLSRMLTLWALINFGLDVGSSDADDLKGIHHAFVWGGIFIADD